MKKAILFVSSLLLSSFMMIGFGQETPEIINVKQSITSGQHQIWSITQGADRLFYFAYTQGVMVFDGANWDTLQLPEKQIVRCVERGKNGEIFAGGYGEFGFWKKAADGQLHYTSLSKDIPLDKVHKEEIWHILPYQDAIYFQSFSTIYKYNYEKVEILTPPVNIMFLQQVEGRLFVQGIDKGLYELRNQNFEFCVATESLAKDKVVGILPFQDNQLLIFTANNGGFVYDFRQLSIWQNPNNDVFKKAQINKCKLLDNQMLAIGTILNGLYLIDSDGAMAFHLSRANGLQNNTILAIFEDNSKALWLGLDQGIDRISLNAPLRFFKDYSDEIGATYTAALLENQLYIGTNRGVFVKNAQQGFSFIEGTQGQVWYLKNIDGQLVCGHNDGTFLIDAQRHVTKISAITGGWIMQVLPNNQGWIQGNYTGLALFKKDAQGQLNVDKKITGFTEPVKNLIIEDDTHIWVVNPYKGFYRLTLSTDLHTCQKVEEIMVEGQKSSTLKASLTKIGENILIHTQSKAYQFLPNGMLQALSTFQQTDLSREKTLLFGGQQPNEYFEIFKEKVNWYQSNHKLQLQVTLISEYECITALDDNTYLFGLSNGYSILNKNNINTLYNTTSWQPIISKIQLKTGEEIFSPNITEPMRLKWAQNGMMIYFGLPEMINGVRFRYQLQGYENQWSAWQTQPMKEFTNLDVGNYTFWVQTDTSEQVVSFSFEILPPWYLSIWAKIIYGLIFLTLMYMLEQWYVLRLKKQKAHIVAEQQRHLEQIRLQNENELLQTTIQNKTKELASSTMNIVEKNEILLKIKEILNEVKKEAGSTFPNKYYQRLINAIDEHLNSEQDWLLFETNFNDIHDQFFKKLLHDFPELTPSDLRLAAYLKMNLSSKELAPLFNISVRGVENKRYRLRQKLRLAAEDNLVDFLLKY